MRIDLLSANDPRTTATTPLRTLWRVGAILEAVAVRDVASGELWLQLDNQRLPARLASGHSGGPLNGEHLQLRVLRDNPVLALETIDDGGGTQITEDALRRFLPRQSSPTALLANLGWLARHPADLQTLPPAVQRALSNLWQALPASMALQDPEQLAQALLHSGTFLEAQLAKLSPTGSFTGQALATQDFKAALLQLQEQLRGLRLEASANQPPPGPMPALHSPLTAMATGPATLSVLDGVAPQLSELKQQTAGCLARITTNQLLHDSAAQQGMLNWLIELPIKHDERPELLRFKFEREARNPTGSGESWTVEVALELANQGPLHVQVSLRGKRLNVQLRSESPALVAALSQQLEALKEGLRSQGLELDRVVCLHGNPVDTAGSRLTRLLDLHA
jgi:Flagellar hook-length control protein FliK